MISVALHERRKAVRDEARELAYGLARLHTWVFAVGSILIGISWSVAIVVMFNTYEHIYYDIEFPVWHPILIVAMMLTGFVGSSLMVVAGRLWKVRGEAFGVLLGLDDTWPGWHPYGRPDASSSQEIVKVE